VYLIHDRAPQFILDFASYGITAIRTWVQAPNMNAIAERFVGSVRREALDHFLLISRKQVGRILSDYVTWYNAQRPHQGLGHGVATGYRAESRGKVLKMPILSGLHHHYYRRAA
jgi:putative transposase